MEESRKAWLQINNSGAGSSSSNSNTSSLQHHDSTSEQHLEELEHRLEDTATTTTSQHYKEEEEEEQQQQDRQSISPIGCWGLLSVWLETLLHHSKKLYMTLHRYRRQVYIALFLAVAQQLCGQTNVLNYAPHIFAEAAGEDDPPAWSTLAIGVVKFVVTVLVIWRIEFLGRRTLLLWGMALTSVGLLALIVAFGGSQSDDPDSWYTNLKSFDLALPGVLLVVCGYSMSFGPLTWLLTSELFPTDIRGRALGGSTIVTYLCASLVTRTFLSAQSAWGPSKVFAVYCCINTTGIIFAYLAIPDTGEKTVEQIEVALQQTWWWRHDAGALLSQIEEEEAEGGSSKGLRSTPSAHGSYTFQTTVEESGRSEMIASQENLPELT
jgi:uncharacterized membrane protein HdeD (DUF308 family)